MQLYPSFPETMKTIHRVGLCCVSVLIASIVQGATITWTNDSGGNWANLNNWSPNHVPGSWDAAETTALGTDEVVLDVSASFGTLNVGAGSGRQTLPINGKTLSVATNATFNSLGNLNFDNG
jgi:hypothetical protein